MKTTIGRFSKNTLSIVLVLCMLLSCVYVGMPPTDAAKAEGEATGYSGWKIYGNVNSWNGDLWEGSGNSGSAYIDASDLVGSYFEFKLVAEGTWCGTSETSEVSLGSQVSLSWDSGNNIKYKVTKGLLKITVNDTKVTVSEDNARYKVYYNTTRTDTGGTGVDLIPQSGSTASRVGTASLAANSTYYFYVKDIKDTKYIRNGTGEMTNTENEVQLYSYDNNNSDSISMTTNIAGTYTFTYDASSKKIKAKYPAYSVTVTNDGNGSATASPTSVEQTNSTILTASPSSGYIFDYWELVSGSVSEGITSSNKENNPLTVTPTADVEIMAHFKSSKFTVTIEAATGGTVTPGSISNLESGEGGTIAATPNSAQNYVFAGWTASPAENVTFANASAASTTFTATAAATITAHFTQETLYDVTVKKDGVNAETYSAGNTINPEITAVDRTEDSYEFDKWVLSGNVQLASGYSATDPTIKIKATGSGGTITATYQKVDYIFFYAALQSNWNSNPKVTINGNEIAPYAWLASYDNNDTPITLYSTDDINSQIGGNNCKTYYIGIFRVNSSLVDKNVYVANVNNPSNYGNAGTLKNDQGRCYYTYSTAAGSGNVSGSIAPQKVNTVTTNKADYDADETVTISKTETVYANTKTAGQDDFTYTFKLVNTVNSQSTDLAADQASSTGTYSFVPQNKSIAAGTYRAVIVTKDAKTGKIINSCESAEFVIQATPTQSVVNFTQTLSGATNTFTGSYRYKNGTATNLTSGTSLRAGSVVTLTLNLKTGYRQGTTTLTGISSSAVTESYNSSTNTVTFTFTVPSGGAAITVSHAAQEITHSITVKRRYFNHNGNTQISVDSTAYKTLSGAGIATPVSTGAAPTVTDYTFKTFVLPTGVTPNSGSLTTAEAISVNATVDNATIYIDYWETVYTITVQNDGHGNVQRSNANVTSTQIGNVTEVTLSAVNNSGYEFKEWQITKGTATTATVNGTSESLGSSAVTVTAPASTTFKFNGTATVKAVFSPVNISLSVSFASDQYASGNVVRITDTSGNLKQSGHIEDTYIIEVTLADGYEVASVTGASGTTPVPETNGNVWKYAYTLGDVNINATVTLKAVKPTLSNVQIKNTSFNFAAYGNPTVNFYLQPTEVKAETQDFAKISYNNTQETKTGQNGLEVSLAQPTIQLNGENATATYILKVKAQNAKPGVETEYSAEQSFTIRVQYNEAQKAYYKLNELFKRCVDESITNNPYYTTDADTALNNYHTAYGEASTFINNGYPNYNATSEETAIANGKYTTFHDAWETLKTYAKKTTIHVLTKYANNASYPMRLKVFSNNTAGGWDQFRMFSGDSHEVSNDIYSMDYEAMFSKTGGTTYYMYSFTYTGHISFNVWRGTSSTDTTMDTNSDQLTGNVTSATDFKEYYIDIKSTNVGTPVSNPSCVEYADYNHTTNGKRVFLEIDETKQWTDAEIKAKFGVAPSGSVVGSIGEGYTTNSAFKIEGPVGKAESETIDLLSKNFVAKTQGKYKVKYTTTYGKTAGNNDIKATKEMILYVAFDDISVYVDMNDNVGNPILNFKYFTDAQGNPAASGTTAYLPYEMDLVTGSESIYKYTFKVSKLKEYGIELSADNPINISYITVENTKVGNGTGFDIGTEARVTGEVWFKADSTKMKTFNLISYGSVTKNFIAVTNDSSHTILPGIKSVHGTGIITDEDEVFHAQYASLYTFESANAPLSIFNYVVGATAEQEVKVGTNTYYFDRWVTYKMPADGVTADNFVYPDSSEISAYTDSAALNYTKAPDYLDENGGSNDIVYVALYKLVSSADSTVRVVVKYEFQDFDTSDGNFIYDENKDTVTANYTKTIKVQLDTTYADFAAVKAAVDTIANRNAPFVKSNYFDYAYHVGSAVLDTTNTKAEENKIVVTAKLDHTAHIYRIILKSGNTTLSDTTGKYQQTVKLVSGSCTNPVWKDSSGNIIGSGETDSTFTARYVSSGNEKDGTTDCQIIKVENGTSTAAAHKSVVSNAYTEVYYTSNGTEMLRHNFYIIDYCAEGELKGGGVLYATTDGTKYRQTGVTDYLGAYDAPTTADSITARKNFITSVLGGDFDTEYKAQTINNVGFRYKPFKASDDVYRYSDELKAYITIFEGTNINSQSYDNQNLRLFSFMVYENNNTMVIVPSDSFAEVRRYKQPQS